MKEDENFDDFYTEVVEMQSLQPNSSQSEGEHEEQGLPNKVVRCSLEVFPTQEYIAPFIGLGAYLQTMRAIKFK